MADKHGQTASRTKLISNCESNDISTKCELCKYLELQLAHTLSELSSARLMIDLLSKEQNQVQSEPPVDSTMTGQWTRLSYKHQTSPTHQQSLKTSDKTQYQHIPETTNRFDVLTNLSTDLENYGMMDERPKVDECNSPRQRNFVRRKNDKLRDRQVHKKELYNKIPTIVNGLSSTGINNKRTCHTLKSDAQKPVDHNIIILGDSHTRGLPSNMKNNLDDIVCMDWSNQVQLRQP
jgi:hypothetical protein